MAGLTVTPHIAYGGEELTLSLANRPDVDLRQVVAVVAMQTGAGGAIYARLPFQAADARTLSATVPPVDSTWTATAIAAGMWEIVLQLPGLELRANVSVNFRTGTRPAAAPAAPPAPPPAPSPGPARSSTPPTANPFASRFPPRAPLSAGVSRAALGSGASSATVSVGGRNVQIPLGRPLTISAGAGGLASGQSASQAAHAGCGGSCGGGKGGCACQSRCCCCSCCCCTDHDDPADTGIPRDGRRLPPPPVPDPIGSRLPRSFPPPAGVIPGSGAGVGEEPVESEMKVRWLVESSNPVREGTGPDFIETSSDPDLFDDTMSGTTPNGGKIPIEPEYDPATAAADNPPIREFKLIVSSQLLSPDNHPIPGQKITFRWLNPPGEPSGDDSKILEVGNDLAVLKQKLADDDPGDGSEFAYADAEGKAYALIRLRLFDEYDLPDLDHRLKGLKAIIGDVVKPPPPPPATGLHTMTHATAASTMAGATTTARSLLADLENLGNILVDHGEAAVESWGRWINGQLEAMAGLPRTVEEFVGFALKRLADGVIVMFPMPGTSLALLTPYADQLRATVIGMLLGIPRGIYAMGRDTIQDLKQLVWDLPRALFNFVADDPKFALQILASVVAPAAGTVFYELDPAFRQKITEAFSKFGNFLSLAGTIISGLFTALSDSSTRSAITSAIGNYFYDEFEKMVGSVATEYLKYQKNGLEYRHFIGAFIGGDILGYVLMTVGVELLLAWFTAGIGNIVSALSKFGKLGRLAGKAAELIHGIITFLQKIGDRISDFVSAMGGKLKNAIGKVMMSIFKFLERFVHAVDDKLIAPLIESMINLAEEVQERVARMFLRLGEDVAEHGDRVGFMADSLITNLLSDPPDRELKAFFDDFLEVMSFSVAKDKDSFVKPNLCDCMR